MLMRFPYGDLLDYLVDNLPPVKHQPPRAAPVADEPRSPPSEAASSEIQAKRYAIDLQSDPMLVGISKTGPVGDLQDWP